MKVVNRPVVEAILTIEEVKVLQGLLCYGVESLTSVVYENLGRSYVEPFENSLHTLKQKVDKVDLSKY